MHPLRVCIVGGIYDRSEDYRKKRAFTPETILAAGLRACGDEVVECGHRGFVPSSAAFDVVHVHHLGKAALLMASAPGGARFVFTGHDPRLMNGYQVSWRRRAAFGFVVRRADSVVTLSDDERRFTRACVPSSRHRLETIANGYRADVFSAAPRAADPRPGTPERPFRLLFVGQLIPMKGVDVLLQALSTLGPRMPWELRLVYQNSSLEPSYRALAARLGIADRVEFLGLKSAAELAELYNAADLFVLPSHGEALPAVITEALMCGLPVVATRVGGIPDQVGPHGYLAPPADPAALAGAIARALGAVAGGRIAHAEISRYANRRFSIDAMVEAHRALYRYLSAGAGARPPQRRRLAFQAVNLGANLLLGAVGPRLAGRGLLTG
jgi:glycosyltransferase involved in cell wall biosynthesis